MSIYNTKLPAIIVIAYNRPDSLRRILLALHKANYPKENIPLIISIDKGKNNQDVLEIANNFEWNHGYKKVVFQEKNLGLKNHILKSMNFVYEYNSIIMLEDDIYVSKNFYTFSVQSLYFSKEKDYIAGISLYNHQLNVHTNKTFSVIEDGYDNWYFQFASSWGQAWNSDQIKLFLLWSKNNPKIEDMPNVPLYVRSWPNKSWLKHFIAYVIDQNKFFLYPKISLTTNFGDTGENHDRQMTDLQVPLLNKVNQQYNFSTLNESDGVYDSFYENIKLGNYLKINGKDLTVDLYGYKSHYPTRFLLSSKILNFEIQKHFGRSLKPHDCNVIHSIKGNDFFLYDTTVRKSNKHKKNKFNDVSYYSKGVSLSDSLILSKNLLIIRLKDYLKKGINMLQNLWK